MRIFIVVCSTTKPQLKNSHLAFEDQEINISNA